MTTRDVPPPAAAGFGWALAALLATLATWPVVFHLGLPAFFHDWTWPLFRDRMLATWQSQVSAWSDSGLGAPNSVPTANPLAWLKIALAVVTPGDVSAKCYLWLSIAAACAGIFRLAHRTFGLDARWSTFAAASFAVSPFIFAKIASGQSSEWGAIAAFVWGLSLMIDAYAGGDVACAAGSALLFALATNQLQFLVFAEIAVMIGWCAFGVRRTALIWAILTSGTVVFAIPSLVFLAQHGPVTGAEISPPYRYWELTQSATTGDAFALLGYALQYPEQRLRELGPFALVTVRWAMWAVGLCAAAGAFLMRDRRVAVLAAVGLVGFVWIAGLRGPASAIWLWTFDRAPSSAFLREFFHGASMLAIPYAVLSAAALSGLGRRSTPVAVGAAAICIGATGLATFSGGLGPVLPHVTPPAYASDLTAIVPANVARVLFLPPERPLFVAGDSVGGNDAYDWIGPHHASLFDYYPPGPLAYANAALNASHADDAVHVLSRVACGAIVWRPDVFSSTWTASAATLRRSLGDGTAVSGGAVLFSIDASPMVSGARAAAPLPPSLRQISGDDSMVFLDEPGRDAAAYLPTGLWSPNPASGWVGYRDNFWMFERGLATPTLGLLTTKVGAVIELPGGDGAGNVLVWAPNGIVIDGRRIVAADYIRIRRSSMPMVLRALGPAAIGEVGEDEAHVQARPSSASAQRVAPWLYRGSAIVHGRGLIVLRQRFDPGWVVSAGDDRVLGHYRADGFGNAWLVDGDGDVAFTIAYAPQRLAFALLALSLLCAGMLSGLALGARRRQ